MPAVQVDGLYIWETARQLNTEYVLLPIIKLAGLQDADNNHSVRGIHRDLSDSFHSADSDYCQTDQAV